MLLGVKKRKGIKAFQMQKLRNVVKQRGDEVMRKFSDKYR